MIFYLSSNCNILSIRLYDTYMIFLYDIFANADPAVADIEFELPPRTISSRPIPFEDD
mgnify:CR=1 FL=1